MIKTLSVALLLSFCAVASADDGWVGYGGTPRLMHSHQSVRMLRETVAITLHKKVIRVNASFWFRNGGGATTVSMGFPDIDDGQQVSGRDEPLKPVLKRFRSWIGGVQVNTRFLRGKDGEGWHVKRVKFGAGETVLVRDEYEVLPGGQDLNSSRVISVADYRLDTGASWHGKIGSGIVTVTFGSDLPLPKTFRSASIIRYGEDLKRSSKPQDVFASGPGKPVLRGRSLIWTFRKLKPTEEDNISVYYWPRDWKERDKRLWGSE